MCRFGKLSLLLKKNVFLSLTQVLAFSIVAIAKLQKSKKKGSAMRSLFLIENTKH